MLRRLLASMFAIGLLSLTLASSSAQTGDVTVYIGGSPIAASTSGAPGSTVTVPVLIIGTTGIVPSARAEITVPAPLRTLAISTCTAETIQATAGATTVHRSCTIVGWDGPNGSQIISAEVEDLSSMTGFRINGWLQIEIPVSTPIGSTYTLAAPSIGLNGFPTVSEFTIQVVAPASSTNPVTTTAVPTVIAQEPLHDIDGSSLDFPMGSIRPFSFSINYDAHPQATSASLTLYTDAGIIEVADPSVIDMEAKHVCDVGAESDSHDLSDSRQPIRTLPNFFNVVLPRWMEPGTEIGVCAEVVYFNGNAVVAIERYKSIITVNE